MWVNYRIFQVFDLLSLYFCCDGYEADGSMKAVRITPVPGSLRFRERGRAPHHSFRLTERPDRPLSVRRVSTERRGYGASDVREIPGSPKPQVGLPSTKRIDDC